MKLAVLIPAAGASTRYAAQGGQRSKLDEDLGGRPLLHRTLDAFNNYVNPEVEVCHLAVAGPHADEPFEAFSLRHGDTLALLGITLIRGGASHRYETTARLVETIPAEATHVAIHDAARPCVSSELLDRLLRAAAAHPAVIPAMPVSDTIKRATATPVESAEADPLAGILGSEFARAEPVWPITTTEPREQLWLAQTPQVFEADLIRRAYQQPDLDSTDDAQLVERLGERVVLVQGDPANVKITHPVDLLVARAVLGLSKSADRPTHKRF